MIKVFIFYLIANLGPTYKFEHSRVIAVYKTEQACRDRAAQFQTDKDYIRVECKEESMILQ